MVLVVGDDVLCRIATDGGGIEYPMVLFGMTEGVLVAGGGRRRWKKDDYY